VRLWSLHPRYLDPKGLVALWREALLAQAVLAGRTRGYRHHPQLARFLEAPDPGSCIAAYLEEVHAEALRRGYRFDGGKIGRRGPVAPLPVTEGQLAYEWSHLGAKLRVRSPDWAKSLDAEGRPKAHPLFRIEAGGIAPWEVLQP
jgi:Pyrimidine dimer DNA glycosylase